MCCIPTQALCIISGAKVELKCHCHFYCNLLILIDILDDTTKTGLGGCVIK